MEEVDFKTVTVLEPVQYRLILAKYPAILRSRSSYNCVKYHLQYIATLEPWKAMFNALARVLL